MALELHRHADAAALDAALAEMVAGKLREGVRRRGSASMVLSGGRTPRGLFARLAATRLPWDRIRITLADDRWVPADHPDSNERTVRSVLLQHEAAAARFVPLYNGAPDPWSGLDAAQTALAQLPRPFDVVLLGMGEDGHTASLFPGHAHDPAGLVHAVHGAPKPPPDRVSLGLAALNDADEVIILVAGEGKREAVARWKAGADLPVAHVHGRHGADVYIDAAADGGV